MQEIKNKRRFTLLVVLTIITLLVFWWIQPENRLDVDQDLFQVEDLDQISKVEITSDTASLTLAYNGSTWRVNDEYNADGNMIRVLFATLQQAKPKRAMADLRRDSIYQRLAEAGVKVSLYDGADLRKEFFAGGNAAKTQAFFADPASKEVYVMTIPGYRVYVSGILELDESGWRDKFVFGFNWRNFKSLRVEYPHSPDENFTVSMTGRDFGVEGQTKSDTARLNTFLDDVSLLTADKYIHKPRLRDSLSGSTPYMKLLIHDVGNRTYGLELFDPQQSGEVLGIIQDLQVAIFDRRKIQQILKPKSFFVKK